MNILVAILFGILIGYYLGNQNFRQKINDWTRKTSRKFQRYK